MVDPLIEAASNNRWRAEAGEPLDDCPGLVAPVLRYRWILVTATLLGAVAGYGISQRASVRYQANAVLILADLAARVSSVARPRWEALTAKSTWPGRRTS